MTDGEAGESRGASSSSSSDGVDEEGGGPDITLDDMEAGRDVHCPLTRSVYARALVDLGLAYDPETYTTHVVYAGYARVFIYLFIYLFIFIFLG